MYVGNKWDVQMRFEYASPYFKYLQAFLREEYKTKAILPESQNIYKAFKYTDFDDVKCVIIGQDPYTSIGTACGLSFSVNRDSRIPQSLNNIFKELTRDLDVPYPPHGNLTSWAEEGVLLLNSILTVQAGKTNSHKDIGWQTFTDAAIRNLSDRREGIAFLLWGKFAQSKFHLIDKSKHLVLETSHPSPHSVHLGFDGCSHFSKVNEYLESQGKTPISWVVK